MVTQMQDDGKYFLIKVENSLMTMTMAIMMMIMTMVMKLTGGHLTDDNDNGDNDDGDDDGDEAHRWTSD